MLRGKGIDSCKDCNSRVEIVGGLKVLGCLYGVTKNNDVAAMLQDTYAVA